MLSLSNARPAKPNGAPAPAAPKKLKKKEKKHAHKK